MKLSCVFCIYTGQPDTPQPPDDELVLIIGGMSVCLDHAPYAPGRMELSRAISAIQEDNRRLDEMEKWR